MGEHAVVVGSGAGGSMFALTLASAGWDVTVLEKGPSYFPGFGRQWPPRTLFSNDELKSGWRFFETPDPLAEPRSFRADASTVRDFVGDVNSLPAVLGGGTVHWDAKVPRFWDLDFAKRSALGPVPGADVSDWPFSYAEIAPYYDEVERLIGVQGDRAALPALVAGHAPRAQEFPMPPGPQQYSSLSIAAGCRRLGLHPYPFPMAINSRPFDGRPACNDCGFCSGYGCPIHARVGALGPLHRAVATGRVRVLEQTFAHRVVLRGRRATGVEVVGPDGRHATLGADVVVLAASAIESVRLALLSGLPDPHDRIGRDLMFHSFVQGFGSFSLERMHAHRGRSTTQCCEDFADPDYPGAREFAAARGLPYLRGGIMELGGSQDPIAEAQVYRYLLDTAHQADPAVKPFGSAFKTLMRASLLRDRLAGISMVGEDLPYPTNRVDLDPAVRDWRGFPVARVTYSPGPHEQAATEFYVPHLMAIFAAAGATLSAAIPSSVQSPVPGGAHVMGGMRMGSDPRSSVTDGYGRVHGLDNVVVGDGAVFPGSGAHNPTNTIMATALRNARHLAGAPTGGRTRP